MKKNIIQIVAFGSLIMLTGLFGCGKDEEDKPAAPYTCATCNTSPEAKAEHNNTSKGIYKGVVVGSSGAIKFDIQNTGSGLSGTLKIDNQTIPLSTSDTLVAGQAFTGTFTGTYNNQPVSIKFSVQSNGSAPTIIEYTIPGHPTTNFQLAKELSGALIKCYEGTTSGQKNNGTAQSGTLNIVLNGNTNTWTAISQSTGESTVNFASGTVSGNTVTCDCGATTVVTGTITGDKINGTYQGSDNSGTWTATRSL